MRKILLLLFCLTAAPSVLRSQHLGDVSITANPQTLFPAGTGCTGSAQTANINNFGQTSHVLTMVPTGSAQSQFFLQGSNDGVLFTRMSDEVDAGNPSSVTLTASGYYTVVRAVITCTGGTFSMTYSGSGVPPSQPAGDGLLAQVEKVLVNGTSVGTTQSGIYRLPYGNMSGVIYANSAGGAFPGGSTLRISCTYNIATIQQATTFALGGATLFVGTVPSAPCVTAAWLYTAGGASANVLEIEHVVSSGFSGASGVGGGGVQGTVGDGASLAGVNPVAIGGQTTTASTCGNEVNEFAYLLGENINDLVTGSCNILGWAIGAGNLNNQNDFTGGTAPNVGPLFTHMFAANVNTPSPVHSINLWATPNGGFTPGQTGANVTGQNSADGLLINQNGWSSSTALTGNASGAQNFTNNAWNNGTFSSCQFQLDFTSITGAATVDVWIKTALNGTNYYDRVHFLTATSVAATEHQVAGIVPGTTGIIPVATQIQGAAHTLAAGTVNNGPIGAWITADWTTVLAGGTVTGMVVSVACN